MNAVMISLISLGCALGGAWIGIWLRQRLPAADLSEETAEIVKLGTGLVGTMAALVLGLLVASAATEFNAEASGLQTVATDFILLDRALRHYGPEAAAASEHLHRVLETIVSQAGTTGNQMKRDSETSVRASIIAAKMFDAIRDLKPHTEAQKMLQHQCIEDCAELAKTRWTLIAQAENPIPTPFLAVLNFWLAALFVGFGLLSPRNSVVLAVLFVSAISVAAAMFIIIDLNQPFSGLIRVSMDPIRDAFDEISKAVNHTVIPALSAGPTSR